MDDLEQTIQQIKAHQRARWYYLKTLQAIDRPLESFARLNYTDWTKAESVDDRKRESRKAIAMVVAAKEGKGPPEFIVQVGVTMKAREPVNAERLSHEKRMCELAALLAEVSGAWGTLPPPMHIRAPSRRKVRSIRTLQSLGTGRY